MMDLCNEQLLIVTNFQKKIGVRHVYKNLHFSIQNYRYKVNEFRVSI